MYKTTEELRAELPSEQLVVSLSQGDILDACPLVFWADQTREVAEGDKPQSVEAVSSRNICTGCVAFSAGKAGVFRVKVVTRQRQAA